jgi:hypothetical protein
MAKIRCGRGRPGRAAFRTPVTRALVWQYGVDDVTGTAPGYLNTPNGFDRLLHDGTTPAHPSTG